MSGCKLNALSAKFRALFLFGGLFPLALLEIVLGLIPLQEFESLSLRHEKHGFFRAFCISSRARVRVKVQIRRRVFSFFSSCFYCIEKRKERAVARSSEASGNPHPRASAGVRTGFRTFRDADEAGKKAKVRSQSGGKVGMFAVSVAQKAKIEIHLRPPAAIKRRAPPSRGYG